MRSAHAENKSEANPLFGEKHSRGGQKRDIPAPALVLGRARPIGEERREITWSVRGRESRWSGTRIIVTRRSGGEADEQRNEKCKFNFSSCCVSNGSQKGHRVRPSGVRPSVKEHRKPRRRAAPPAAFLTTAQLRNYSRLAISLSPRKYSAPSCIHVFD